MQFLFVVLMSVLVGASALPHILQAPNRPSFSLRKNTDFSLVAIPKFLQKVVQIDRKLASIEEEQARKKQDLAQSQEVKNEEMTSEGASAEQEVAENPNQNPSGTEGQAPKNVVDAKHGNILLDNVDLQSCICGDNRQMKCQVWIEGYCSNEDEFIDVVVKTEENDESNKHFRCKELNRFSGTVPVQGGGIGKVSISFMDQKLEQTINLINYCGQLGTDKPAEDE